MFCKTQRKILLMTEISILLTLFVVYSVTIYVSECVTILSETYALMMVTLLSPILSEGPTGPVLSTAITACIRGFGSVRFSLEKGK